MNKLEVHQLGKRYLQRWVVKEVSLSVHSGEIVGLLGPNGAGKTTSFYMTVGLIKANRGTITLNGENITKLPIHQRAKMGIGYLPQESSIFRKLSVYDNIMAILETVPDFSKEQRVAKCESLLAEFHIEHIAKNRGNSLSGGERRRVEIARALAIEPQFMLLDEPFAGVDPISIIDIKRIIKQLKDRNLGVLITDHNVRETLDICDRAYIANDGNIIAEGTSQEILANKQVQDVYLGEKFKI